MRSGEIADLLVIDHLRKKFGIDSGAPPSTCASPGTRERARPPLALRMGELLSSLGYLSEDADEAFKVYLERRMERPRFANGRSVRNPVERARLRHASRVVIDMEKVGKDDLMRIEAEDTLKSRVFADQDEGMYGQSGNWSEGSSDEDGKNGKTDSKSGAEAKGDDGKSEADGRNRPRRSPGRSVRLEHGVVAEVGEEGAGAGPHEHH